MDNTQDEAWLAFAAFVLFIAGIMRIFDAIWAFRYHGAVPQNLEDAIFGHSLKTYGWIDLVVAAIMLISAALVLSRSQVARWIGVFAGAVLAISAVSVDSVLPRLVADVRRHGGIADLCARRARGRERTQGGAFLTHSVSRRSTERSGRSCYTTCLANCAMPS